MLHGGLTGANQTLRLAGVRTRMAVGFEMRWEPAPCPVLDAAPPLVAHSHSTNNASTWLAVCLYTCVILSLCFSVCVFYSPTHRLCLFSCLLEDKFSRNRKSSLRSPLCRLNKKKRAKICYAKSTLTQTCFYFSGF